MSVLAEHLGTSPGILKPKHDVKLKELMNKTLKVKDIIGTCLNVVVINEITIWLAQELPNLFFRAAVFCCLHMYFEKQLLGLKRN